MFGIAIDDDMRGKSLLCSIWCNKKWQKFKTACLMYCCTFFRPKLSTTRQRESYPRIPGVGEEAWSRHERGGDHQFPWLWVRTAGHQRSQSKNQRDAYCLFTLNIWVIFHVSNYFICTCHHLQFKKLFHCIQYQT